MSKSFVWGAPWAVVILVGCGPTGQGSAALGVFGRQAQAALTNGTEYIFVPEAVAQEGNTLCLDVRNGSTSDPSVVQLWECNGSSAQQFSRKGNSIQALGKMCLEIKEGHTYEGGKVQMSRCEEGASRQQWEAVGRQLKVKGSDVCLEVVNGLMNQGGALQVGACSTNTMQQHWVSKATTKGDSRSNYDSSTNQSKLKILWEDTFSGPEIDSNNWIREITCVDGASSNANKTCFTDKETNSFIEDGKLHIKLQKSSQGERSYTSARLMGQSDGAMTYGRLEVRMKVPCGKGFWSAVRLLPKNESYGPWPQSGELDVAEILGRSPDTVHGTAHYGEAPPNNRSRGGSHSLSSGDYCDDFHVFAVERSNKDITWFVDDNAYLTLTPEDANFAPASPWPYDAPFRLDLELSMGQGWAGAPDGSIEDGELIVDYLRVYAPEEKGKDSSAKTGNQTSR